MARSENNLDIRAERRARIASRITEIDLLRGIAVILMVFDHFMFDVWGLYPQIFAGFPKYGTFWDKLYDLSFDYWMWKVRIAVRYVVLFVFLSLTGISCSFSKSNMKRGLILGAIALVLTLATFIIGKMTGDGEMLITFGILHLISLSIIVVALLEKLTANKWVYLAIGAAMMIVGAFLLKEEVVFYSSDNFIKLFFKQFVGLVVLGPDGYSFLFYGGQVFIGVFLGKLLYPQRMSLIFKKGYSDNPVTFIGRHSLIVYVAHQAVIPVVVSLVLLLCGYKLQL